MKKVRRIRLIFYACVAVGLMGCGSGYVEGPRFAQGTVTPKRKWKVSGSLSNPDRVLDGDAFSAAFSARYYNAGELTIDLGEMCMFNMVVIDHGSEEMGFCRRVAVETSVNGKDFTKRAEVSGTRRVTVISIVTPTLARHVRLKVISPGERRWSVAEIYLQ